MYLWYSITTLEPHKYKRAKCCLCVGFQITIMYLLLGLLLCIATSDWHLELPPVISLWYGYFRIATWDCHLFFAAWDCHLRLTPVIATWDCHLGYPFGIATWDCHLGFTPVIGTRAIWDYHLGIDTLGCNLGWPPGITICDCQLGLLPGSQTLGSL